MRRLSVNGVVVENSFAEAFDMRATALIITADSRKWARQAATTMTGFATSVIGCGCEAGIDRELTVAETPDGRPGVRVLLFAVSTAELQKQVLTRVGQCVLTAPGSACYGAIAGEEKLKLGAALRYFGDGWQISKKFGGRHYWRVPVMDGEFVCEATIGMTKAAVGGGNLIIMGASATNRARTRPRRRCGASARRATSSCLSPAASFARARRSARNTRRCSPPPMTPIARRSRARSPRSSAARSRACSRSSSTGSPPRRWATRCAPASPPSSASARRQGALRIDAGNYGGKLGRHHFHLRTLLP